jgi:hypothetical protein
MSADHPSKSVMLVRPGGSISDESPIWRYLRFDRFVEILATHKVWFSRPYKFDDRWEGLFPPSYLRRTRQYADAHGLPFEDFDRDFRARTLRHRYGHYVNCWHISDRENDAMWKLYGTPWKLDGMELPGVAIQSTIGDVKACLRPHNSGPVIYYDPSHEVMSTSIFGPNDILFKRDFFAWEREYRFWFDDDDVLQKIEDGIHVAEQDLSHGQAVRITDMQRFIKKIVVAPSATDEFLQEVQATCVKHKRRWLCNVIERSYSDRMWDTFTR